MKDFLSSILEFYKMVVFQMASLERLQMENEEAGMKLQKAVEKGGMHKKNIDIRHFLRPNGLANVL